jgi:hypothetical protein
MLFKTGKYNLESKVGTSDQRNIEKIDTNSRLTTKNID